MKLLHLFLQSKVSDSTSSRLFIPGVTNAWWHKTQDRLVNYVLLYKVEFKWSDLQLYELIFVCFKFKEFGDIIQIKMCTSELNTN